MSFTLTKKQLFHAIKDKKGGLHPTVKVTEPRFAACAEEASGSKGPVGPKGRWGQRAGGVKGTVGQRVGGEKL